MRHIYTVCCHVHSLEKKTYYHVPVIVCHYKYSAYMYLLNLSLFSIFSFRSFRYFTFSIFHSLYSNLIIIPLPFYLFHFEALSFYISCFLFRFVPIHLPLDFSVSFLLSFILVLSFHLIIFLFTFRFLVSLSLFFLSFFSFF